MRYVFHPAARVEFREAIEYLESARTGLGGSFVREIEAVVQEVCDNPFRWRVVEGRVRRGLSRRFPYAVLYSIEDDYLLIVSIMHCSRKPGYWRKRI